MSYIAAFADADGHRQDQLGKPGLQKASLTEADAAAGNLKSLKLKRNHHSKYIPPK